MSGVGGNAAEADGVVARLDEEALAVDVAGAAGVHHIRRGVAILARCVSEGSVSARSGGGDDVGVDDIGVDAGLRASARVFESSSPSTAAPPRPRPRRSPA